MALQHKYERFLYKTNTIVFTILPDVKRAKSRLCRTVITKLPYVPMLFISQLTCTAGIASQLENE